MNPVTTAMGTPGNDAWEGNRRLDTGGASTIRAELKPTPSPMYPNAWGRLQRVGSEVHQLSGATTASTGSTLGATTWGLRRRPNPHAHARPRLRGPEYTPENGNITAAFQGEFGRSIRDYRNTVPWLLPR